MHRPLHILIPLTFLTGIVLGYFELLPLPGQNDHCTPEYLASKRANVLIRTSNSTYTSLPLPTSTNTNALLLRYSSLSPQKTKEELLRLIDYEKNNEQTYCHNAIQYLAFKLGEQSPEEVKEILQNKQKYKDYESYLPELVEGWAQTDIDGAIAYLLDHKREWDNAPKFFRKLVRDKVRQSPDTVLQWFKMLSKGERSNALISIAAELPLHNPGNMPELAALLNPEDFEIGELELVVQSQIEEGRIKTEKIRSL